MEKLDLLRNCKSKHKKKKIAGMIMAIVFLIFGSLYLSYRFFYAPRELNSGNGFFASLAHLITSGDRALAAGRDNINILLLGMGGEGHDGPYLTDTMLLVSINKTEGKLGILSIPRDLMVDTSKYGKQKINAVNSYAEVEKVGSGAKYTASVLDEMLAINIDYYVRMDFSGFKEIIDAVGGLDIDVPTTFTDPLFPRAEVGSGASQTITVTFQKGLQHMDGETALIYARSRHGNNGEGSDFARSRRQEQIILTLKDKVLSSETLTSFSKIKTILDIVKNNVNTNISPAEAVRLAALYKNLNVLPENITVNVLANGPNGPLYSTYYNNQYVLLPKKSDFSDLRRIVANPFQSAADSMASYTPSNVSVLVLNGTTKDGLAGETAMTLTDFGYKIKETGNAPTRDFEKNVIYNVSVTDNSGALQDIKNILNANVSPSVPEWLKPMIASAKPDFVIVVGTPVS